MNADLDAYREQSLSSWSEVASGWEDRDRWMSEAAGSVSEWILERAELQPGQTVLELASGPGDLGRRTAARVGPTGTVISTDFAPEMVDAARRLGEDRGLTNLDYRVLDAERMALDSDSVDAVVCRWGYMLMADPAAALRETRRVLRAGGPLATSVWAGAEQNPWAALPAGTLVARGHLPKPEPGTPGIFALADPDRLRTLIADAGFAEPVVEEIAFEFRYADFDDLWGTQAKMSMRLARALGELPAEELEATRAAIIESLVSFREPDGSYRIPALCLGALAR